MAGPRTTTIPTTKGWRSLRRREQHVVPRAESGRESFQRNLGVDPSLAERDSPVPDRDAMGERFEAGPVSTCVHTTDEITSTDHSSQPDTTLTTVRTEDQRHDPNEPESATGRSDSFLIRTVEYDHQTSNH